MLETIDLKKKFDNITAVDGVSLKIAEGSIFGLIGTNGSGKSTYMRMLSGILRPDEGVILLDDMPVYENPKAKKEICLLADEQYFPVNANISDMKKYYAMMYENFDSEKFDEMVNKFGLSKTQKIRTFSKGMKKQIQILLGVCSNTKYLLCDETFDGLDPVVRQAVKSIFAAEALERQFTPIIASHNLRELEDICDSVGILYKGNVLLSKDLLDLKLGIHKLQCVPKDESVVEKFKEYFDVVKDEKRGSLHVITIKGEEDNIREKMQSSDLVYWEILPLSLEEIFISETEVIGYDIKKLIM